MTAGEQPAVSAIQAELASQMEANAELRRVLEAATAANDAKTRYLVAVSHEIRSPLNTIYGYAQLLERDDAIPGVEAGAVIRRSAEHLTNLVEGLLEISRIEGGVIKLRTDVIDFRGMLEHVMEMFQMQAASKGLRLELVIKDRLPEQVKTDEKRLRQILINLVSNAVKYTQQGGATITVGYRSQVADVVVSDTGIGIAQDEHDRIFEPFERGGSAEAQRQPGIGLGLAITRLLAVALGGDITVASAPGEGSRFRLKLMLPQPATPAAGVAPRGIIMGYQGDRRTVLLVDDDPAQRRVLQTLLSRLGFVVHVAGNGEEGLALAGRNPPDIVLLDIQMPGISGWDVCERLRARHGNALKIVMVSANAHEFRAGNDGCSAHDAFVTKPIDFDGLLAAIGTQLTLRWDEADVSIPPTGRAPPVAGPPPEAADMLRALRDLARIGHMAGIEDKLDEFEAAFPAAASFASVLRRHVNDFDLRSLGKALDDAAR